MLLEVEAGYAKNEPVTFAVRKAIEKGVVDLINQGAEKGLWEFEKIKEVEVPEIKDYIDDDGTNKVENGIHVDIGEVKPEKTYEDYLEEKKLKKENESADEVLKELAAEEEWNQLEETEKENADEKDNDSDSDSSGDNN